MLIIYSPRCQCSSNLIVTTNHPSYGQENRQFNEVTLELKGKTRITHSCFASTVIVIISPDAAHHSILRLFFYVLTVSLPNNDDDSQHNRNIN